jgi:hypothetical protein
MSKAPERTEIEANILAFSERALNAKRQSERFEEHALSRGRQITVWVMLANGGALLLCFNGLLDHKICDWPAFVVLVYVFIAGLIASFVTALLDYTSQAGLARAYSEFSGHSEAIVESSRAALDLENEVKAVAQQPDAAKIAELSAISEKTLAKVMELRTAGTKLLNRVKRQEWVKRGSALLLGIAMLAFAGGLIAAVTLPRFSAAICST